MTLAQTGLRVCNYLSTGTFLLLAGGSLVAWARAILHWGNPQPYATAMLWSFFAAVALGVVLLVEWLQNGGA